MRPAFRLRSSRSRIARPPPGNRVRVSGVARRIFRELDEAAIERAQVARHMGELRPRRRAEEPGVDQAVAAARQLGAEARGRRPAATRAVASARDAGRRSWRPGGTRPRPPPAGAFGALHLLGERPFGPRQRVVADERAIADGGDHVGQQRLGRDRRPAAAAPPARSRDRPSRGGRPHPSARCGSGGRRRRASTRRRLPAYRGARSTRCRRRRRAPDSR